MIRRLENLSEGQKNYLAELTLKSKKYKLEQRNSQKLNDKRKKNNEQYFIDPNTGVRKLKIRPNYSNVGIGEDVKEMTTRYLISELKEIRYKSGSEEYDLQLRAELSKREHIPTKKENKKIRQESAKRKK